MKNKLQIIIVVNIIISGNIVKWTVNEKLEPAANKKSSLKS